jgi:hypothetical protein
LEESGVKIKLVSIVIKNNPVNPLNQINPNSDNKKFTGGRYVAQYAESIYT